MSVARTRAVGTRLKGVTYDVYVQLRDAPGNDHYRMAYHDGVLEIMSPAKRHERGSRRIYTLVMDYAVVFKMDCEPAGSTTFRKGKPTELKGSGREPDESFYLGREAVLVRNREDIDLAVDPPPSLWIEIDHRGSSASRVPVYAALGVPELWRYWVRSRRLWFGRLEEDHYEELAESVVLPGLTPRLVLELLAEAGPRGTVEWSRWLREERLPELREGIGGR